MGATSPLLGKQSERDVVELVELIGRTQTAVLHTGRAAKLCFDKLSYRVRRAANSPIAAAAASYARPGSRPPPAAGIGVLVAVQAGGSTLAQRSTASPRPIASFPHQHPAG